MAGGSSVPLDIGRRTNDGGLARPQGCRYLQCIYVAYGLGIYGHTFVRSLALPDFRLTKPRNSFGPGYVAKASIWDFRSVSPYRSLPRFNHRRPSLSCSPLWRLVADTSPLQAWILWNEMRRNGERGRAGENGRTGADTELRVGFGNGRTVLADRPPAGDIKRELWPNLCRRACSMLSLYRIGRWARMPETSANCVPITSAADMDPRTRISRLSSSYRWRRRRGAGRKSAANIGYKWFGNYDFPGEGRAFHLPPVRNSPRGRYAGIFGPGYIVSAFLTRDSLPRSGRTLFPGTLRPVMNQKWTDDVSLDARRRYRPKTSAANLRSHTWWRLYTISGPTRRQSCASLPTGSNVNDAQSRFGHAFGKSVHV